MHIRTSSSRYEMTKSRLILAEFLPYQLSVTSNAVSDLIAQSYRGRFALKIPEWRVMAVLGERAESTQRDLVSMTAMDKVTVNRATRTLEDRGLIKRAPNHFDGRSHQLALTITGRELYGQIVPLAQNIEQQLEQALDPGDAQKLQEILGRLRQNVQKIIPATK
jgi:DNA-binding MarR family transcriptional regulator